MSNPRKALGKALEKKVAQMGGGTVQPLSGQLPEFPNDVDLDEALVECKVRAVHYNAAGTRYITIDLDWLNKVIKNAKDRLGVVAVRPKGSPKVYAVLDFSDFLDLLKRNT